MDYREPIVHVGYGVRWDPLGVLADVSRLVRRLGAFLARSAVREQMRDHWTEEGKRVSPFA